MKKIIFVLTTLMGSVAYAASPQPQQVIEVLPASQYHSSTTYAGSMGYTSAVSISPTVITRIDSAFNTVIASTATGLGADYQRVEITVQNNDTTAKFCGYSETGLTTANSFKIAVGAVWTFKVGKGLYLYCLNETGTGTLIVGGVAWK